MPVGPAPKHEAQRRNTHPKQRGEWVDLPELDKPVLPALSKVAPGVTFKPQVRRLWDAWRSDPVTQEWSQADLAYAVETILLRNSPLPGYAASEVRLRMDGLGLTPKGKRDLRWRLPEQTVAPNEREKNPGRAPRKARRRAHLMAVK